VTNVTSPISLRAGQHLVVTQIVPLAANLWSLDTPYLYNLVSTVTNQGAAADVYTTPFGVRMVSVRPGAGCFHQWQARGDSGHVQPPGHGGRGFRAAGSLQYFRIEKLKQMGVNAYRTSHNAPTPELLDACDRLGMLVLDENRRIGTNAEPLGELSRQILRDRNHPSVFAWSLANEEWTHARPVPTAFQSWRRCKSGPFAGFDALCAPRP
jgi:beta-galactosidase